MEKNNLSATYYPSCVVNLRLRFDEAFVPGLTAPPGLTVDGLAESPPTTPVMATGALKIFENQSREGSHVTGRIPKTCSVELPAYRQAGKFRMTFDFRDLPIDPRMVRAAGVEIYMDSVAADDYATSIVQTSPIGGERGSQLTRRNRLSSLKASPDNMLMQGIVDSWNVAHSTSGSEVTIEGRDLKGMFLNTPVTAEAISTIKLGRRIDDVIRDLIQIMQGWAAGMQVIASPADLWPNKTVPLVGLSFTEQVATPRVRRAAITRAIRLSSGADPDKLNFWDVITRWCFYVGAVPTFTLTPDATIAAATGSASPPYKVTLLIRPAQSLYDQWEATDEGTRSRPPFKDYKRRIVDGRSFAVRRMMFGRNIEELTFERKFAGVNLPKLVAVVSYNPSSIARGEDRLLTAYYPPEVAAKAVADNLQLATNTKSAKKSRVAPSGEIAAQDQIRIPIPGITDTEILENLAKQIYEEVTRGEMGGSCRTKSLASFGAGNEDPDLVRLRPGDGIMLTVDARQLQARAPSVSPLNAMQQKTPDELTQDLNTRLGDLNLSRAIAYTMGNALQAGMNTYRVSNVRYDWSISNGISVAFDFHNFVAVRNAVSGTPAATANVVEPTGSGTAVPAPK